MGKKDEVQEQKQQPLYMPQFLLPQDIDQLIATAKKHGDINGVCLLRYEIGRRNMIAAQESEARKAKVLDAKSDTVDAPEDNAEAQAENVVEFKKKE